MSLFLQDCPPTDKSLTFFSVNGWGEDLLTPCEWELESTGGYKNQRKGNLNLQRTQKKDVFGSPPDLPDSLKTQWRANGLAAASAQFRRG